MRRVFVLALALATAAQADGLDTLKVGDAAALEGGASVRFVRVVSDSRCPEGVVCAWGGQATVEVALVQGREARSIELMTLPEDQRVGYVGGWKLELVKLDPPRPKRDGKPPEYRLSLAATRATSGTTSPSPSR